MCLPIEIDLEMEEGFTPPPPLCADGNTDCNIRKGLPASAIQIVKGWGGEAAALHSRTGSNTAFAVCL
jgi:hypothetical protein